MLLLQDAQAQHTKSKLIVKRDNLKLQREPHIVLSIVTSFLFILDYIQKPPKEHFTV